MGSGLALPALDFLGNAATDAANQAGNLLTWWLNEQRRQGAIAPLAEQAHRQQAGMEPTMLEAAGRIREGNQAFRENAIPAAQQGAQRIWDTAQQAQQAGLGRVQSAVDTAGQNLQGAQADRDRWLAEQQGFLTQSEREAAATEQEARTWGSKALESYQSGAARDLSAQSAALNAQEREAAAMQSETAGGMSELQKQQAAGALQRSRQQAGTQALAAQAQKANEQKTSLINQIGQQISGVMERNFTTLTGARLTASESRARMEQNINVLRGDQTQTARWAAEAAGEIDRALIGEQRRFEDANFQLDQINRQSVQAENEQIIGFNQWWNDYSSSLLGRGSELALNYMRDLTFMPQSNWLGSAVQTWANQQAQQEQSSGGSGAEWGLAGAMGLQTISPLFGTGGGTPA